MRNPKRNTILMVTAAMTLIAGIACQAPAPPPPQAPPPPDYAADLGPVADTFIEVWNSQEYDNLDGIMTADFQRVAPDQNADGLAAMKDFMAQVHTTYPDFYIVVDESAYKENVGFLLWTVTGTNTGEGAFPPTGNSIDVSGITMLRFVGGKISQEVAHYDTATLMNQLGISAVPHTAE